MACLKVPRVQTWPLIILPFRKWGEHNGAGLTFVRDDQSRARGRAENMPGLVGLFQPLRAIACPRQRAYPDQRPVRSHANGFPIKDFELLTLGALAGTVNWTSNRPARSGSDKQEDKNELLWSSTMGVFQLLGSHTVTLTVC